MAMVCAEGGGAGAVGGGAVVAGVVGAGASVVGDVLAVADAVGEPAGVEETDTAVGVVGAVVGAVAIAGAGVTLVELSPQPARMAKTAKAVDAASNRVKSLSAPDGAHHLTTEAEPVSVATAATTGWHRAGDDAAVAFTRVTVN
jgi:hypothetical protein